LPADSLAQAEHAVERGEQIRKAHKKAFADFSDKELMILDGVMLEPAPKRRR